ncbi:hypothetical protein [Nocardia crassostreae]|uniref:hypothetical protein n=1 Tax=Nocardia crassostreae TaxID=53428 RepID=UPI000B0AC5F2|nr:hypothetical protein [Nocardia crassostreae]
MKFTKSAAYAVTVAALSGGAVFAPVTQAVVGLSAPTAAAANTVKTGCGDCEPDVI